MPTKINWADETVNPLGWGCYGPGGTPEKPKPCSYCYAKRIAARNLRPCPLCRKFTPHWHSEQLDKPHRWKKSRRIFVQSMGDLMHPYIPEFQIFLVQKMIQALPRHTFILSTKNPARYRDFNPWSDNCILLTTCENQQAADERIPELLQAQARVLGVSHEPLLGEIDPSPWLGGFFCDGCGKEMSHFEKHHEVLGDISDRFPDLCGYVVERPGVDWAIIGAMTGPWRVPFQPRWVENLINKYKAAEVPVFLKDNLTWWKKIQEWPKEIP